MTLRDAIAQSINVPSVKLLYLAGIANSLQLAKSMGISTLGDPNQYGLTLVLGGGEVTLLDMTSAYGTFAQRRHALPRDRGPQNRGLRTAMLSRTTHNPPARRCSSRKSPKK